MKLPFHPAATLLLSISALAACGGGGGDPGTCHGSPEVCSEGQASTAATPPTTNTGTGATNTTSANNAVTAGPPTNASGGY